MSEQLSSSIKITNLNKSYGKKQVLFDINLEIYEGELFGFIGKNGVGKSTTIECVLGSKLFDSGEILVEGLDIKEKPIEVKKLIGYVASEPTCYEDMTGMQYLQFIGSIYSINPQIFIKNISFLLKKFEFNEEDLYREIREYSHGMKQKVCLMASLIHNPKIWILDEPTVGLDAMSANELSLLMKDYVKHGNTCFVASHNIDLISKLCDRVAIIKDGRIYEVYDLKHEPSLRNRMEKIFLKLYQEKEEWLLVYL